MKQQKREKQRIERAKKAERRERQKNMRVVERRERQTNVKSKVSNMPLHSNSMTKSKCLKLRQCESNEERDTDKCNYNK